MTSNKALPIGSLVIVIGLNGYIASHVADQLLKRGYRVRGTARSASKLDAIIKTLKARTPNAEVDGVVVKDVQAKDAFTELFQGAAGIIHLAAENSMSPDPNQIIPPTVDGMKHILDAAAGAASVKRFVYTSSTVTLPRWKTGETGKLSSSDWNTDRLKQAWAPPPYEKDRSFLVYAAGKIAGEQAAWDYVQEKKPSFVLNAVLPALVAGPVLEAANASTASYFTGVFRGDQEHIDMLRVILSESTWHVDVVDVAILHVAALLEEDVNGERILANGEKRTFQAMIEAMKKIEPSKDYPEPANEDENLVEWDSSRTVELLKRYGVTSVTSLHDSIRNQLAHAQGIGA